MPICSSILFGDIEGQGRNLDGRTCLKNDDWDLPESIILTFGRYELMPNSEVEAPPRRWFSQPSKGQTHSHDSCKAVIREREVQVP